MLVEMNPGVPQNRRHESGYRSNISWGPKRPWSAAAHTGQDYTTTGRTLPESGRKSFQHVLEKATGAEQRSVWRQARAVAQPSAVLAEREGTSTSAYDMPALSLVLRAREMGTLLIRGTLHD